MPPACITAPCPRKRVFDPASWPFCDRRCWSNSAFLLLRSLVFVPLVIFAITSLSARFVFVFVLGSSLLSALLSLFNRGTVFALNFLYRFLPTQTNAAPNMFGATFALGMEGFSLRSKVLLESTVRKWRSKSLLEITVRNHKSM